MQQGRVDAPEMVGGLADVADGHVCLVATLFVAYFAGRQSRLGLAQLCGRVFGVFCANVARQLELLGSGEGESVEAVGEKRRRVRRREVSVVVLMMMQMKICATGGTEPGLGRRGQTRQRRLDAQQMKGARTALAAQQIASSATAAARAVVERLRTRNSHKLAANHTTTTTTRLGTEREIQGKK